jgi:hypothetical protein
VTDFQSALGAGTRAALQRLADRSLIALLDQHRFPGLMQKLHSPRNQLLQCCQG